MHVLSAIGKGKDMREILKSDKVQKLFEENVTSELFSKEFGDLIKVHPQNRPFYCMKSGMH